MPEPSPEAWAQIRYDYEHTDRPVVEICVEHRLTANTLRLRARRWGWRMRRARIPAEGPPPLTPRSETEITEPGPRFPPSHFGLRRTSRGDERGESEAGGDVEPSPHIGVPIAPAADESVPIGQRLQGAVARVLPAIEMNLARLSAGPVQPREMEMAARTLGSLMRTLRELNGLLGQHRAKEPDRDIEQLRRDIAQKLEGILTEEREAMPRRYLAGWEEFAAEAGGPVDVRGRGP